MTVAFSTAAQLDRIEGIRHGFFGRSGGVSGGIYRGLNCGPFSQDAASAIEQNRALVVTTLGAHSLVTNKQVHGARVRRIDGQSDLAEFAEADGLVTTVPGIALGALGADCAPVLFADVAAGVIGAAHAGWQGALVGVTDAVIDNMCSAGATPGAIVVAVGPAIQKQSYEVGEAFQEKLVAQSPIDAAGCFYRHESSSNVHFDLPGYIRLRLQRAGINTIEVSPDDTYSDAERFFSYRRSCHQGEPDYGRQVGAICLTCVPFDQDSSSSQR